MRNVQGPRPASRAGAAAHTPAARRGRAAERVIGAALAAALDDRFVLVHDLYLPGGPGAIDLVVVGPRILAIAVAVVESQAVVRVSGWHWEEQIDGQRWMPRVEQPSLRARSAGARVAYALRSAGLPAYGVTPVVALIGADEVIIHRSRVPVLRPAELAATARAGGGVAESGWPDLVVRALLVAASAATSD